jgi:putative ABC transport system permease protein
VLQRAEVIAGEAGVVRRLNLLMVLLALAALAASTLGLLATTRAGVMQRAPELALLRVLGATPAALATLLLAESLLVAVAGGVLGWGLGALGAVAIRGDAFGTHLAPSLLLLPAAIVVALAVALAATLGPLRGVLALDAARVLRD